MRISEAKDVIKELYQNTKVVTALVSERGVGKTSAYQQCAEELGYDYIALYAAALEGPDFMGLPAKDLEKGITRYLAPQFLPTKAAIESGLYAKKGILVLEEINRVPSDTVSVLYPLLLESKINGHELGEGWHIGVTMNPDTLNYLVNSLDDAMLDRFITIAVEPNIDDYLAYSRTHDGNEEILSFLKSHPDMLLMTNRANESGLMTKAPTPRGWTKVQDIMNQCTLEKHLLKELIAGIVGPIAANTFISYSSGWHMDVPSAQAIVSDYASQQEKIKLLVEDNQTPVLSKVIEHVIDTLEETEEMVIQVDAFLKDLPDEMCMYFYKMMTREREEIFEFYSARSLVFEDISDLIISKMTK